MPTIPIKTIVVLLCSSAFLLLVFCISAIANKDEWRNQFALEIGEKKIINKKASRNSRGRDVVYGRKTLYSSDLPPLIDISDVKIKRRDLYEYGINSHHWDAHYKITNKSEHSIRRIVVTASYAIKGNSFTNRDISSYPECMLPGETIDGDKIWLNRLASLDLTEAEKGNILLYATEALFCN